MTFVGKSFQTSIPMLDDAYAILSAIPRGQERRIAKFGQSALKGRFQGMIAHAGLVDLSFHDVWHVGTSRRYMDRLDLVLATAHRDLKGLARDHEMPDGLREEADGMRTVAILLRRASANDNTPDVEEFSWFRIENRDRYGNVGASVCWWTFSAIALEMVARIACGCLSWLALVSLRRPPSPPRSS
jgi:hypothetical protein